MDCDIYIDPDGRIRAVYDDVLVDLFEGENVTVTRASRVEPVTEPCPDCALVDGNHRDGCAYDGAELPMVGWMADMRPSRGPVLGLGTPFRTRAEALAAERAWLDSQMGS